MVHAVLIVKEAELVIIRADAIHQLLRVMSFQPRADNENKQKAKATQEDLDKLIEIQNTLGVFDTPKSIAEREKMQNEINEASEVDNNK